MKNLPGSWVRPSKRDAKALEIDTWVEWMVTCFVAAGAVWAAKWRVMTAEMPAEKMPTSSAMSVADQPLRWWAMRGLGEVVHD